MTDKLKKSVTSWVQGDRFFNREHALDALAERVREGDHTLLTAQRRMGKTSLVRELLRRFKDEGHFETIFVDLEAAADPADAIAEIGARSRSSQRIWERIKSAFPSIKTVELEVDASAADLRAKIRAGVDSGNWWQKGDSIFEALAANDRPVVLVIDELPILVNRVLKDNDYRITSEGQRTVDDFLSWLRKKGQEHQDRVRMILSGSVGLEPILQQAGLSALANIFSPYDLKPWDEGTATACLRALGANYGLDLPENVCQAMCQRLRCLVPHHVQRFFDVLHEDRRDDLPCRATLEDVDRVYDKDMLGVRGQMDLTHYEGRLKMVLGPDGYQVALEMLTDAARDGGQLSDDAVARYHKQFLSRDDTGLPSINDVLHVLEHDGYLEKQGDGYGFVSGLLEDWWRVRYGRTARHPARPKQSLEGKDGQ